MMTREQLIAIFKPDKYGFCRVKQPDGTEFKVWFDTVEQVAGIIERES
jgi:hypothetical protein